ncbi:unnamed protein product, partial [Brassica napus]
CLLKDSILIDLRMKSGDNWLITWNHVAKSLGLLFPQTPLSTDVLLLFFLDMTQKRKRCNLMEVTSEIGTPLLSLHPKFGIAVWGYDTSLPEDEVESVLRQHFSSCGGITHVYIDDKRANIYFSEEHEETSALGLHRSEVRGFRITTRRLATARRNHSLAPGQSSRRIGYTRPAITIEFAPEIGRKVRAFKKIKRIVKKVMALRRMKEATTKERLTALMKEKRLFLSPIILSPKD